MGTKPLLFAVLVIAVVCVGCPPQGRIDQIDLTGHWEGTIVEDRVGEELIGTLTGDIVHQGDEITGIWTSTFDDPSLNNGGSLTGIVDGKSLTATFTPSDARYCSLVAVATFTRNTIKGSYSAINCSITQTGHVELHRRW